MKYRQIDCFRIHLIILKVLGIWPSRIPSSLYKFYAKIFIFLFAVLFNGLYTINFYFLPPQLEIFADEMIFYFMCLAVLSKVVAFVYMRDDIREMLEMLEGDSFQAEVPEEMLIIDKAKKDALLYWKVTCGISVVANSVNVFTPLLMHLIFSVELEYPVCRYSFISEKYKHILTYPAYVYQGMGITSHMLYNVNFDTFLLGVMFLAIAQLDILDKRLRTVTDFKNKDDEIQKLIAKDFREHYAVLEINKCIKHYDDICKYCRLIQDAFSETLFIQFSLGSCKICVCLFRFTLPATTDYLIFLSLYMIVMILQIMVPCWFGSSIIERSGHIPFAVYNCKWISRCQRFKSNLKLFVERANRPLTITGGKMFLLSLRTFTAIMNSAYSFFALLRHMQTR